MSDEKTEAQAQERGRSLEETLIAINLFLNYGLSAKEALERSRPPESSTRFDGETWRTKAEDG